ncbi:MAG: aminoglycoside phosphotransferase family protein [Chloroflexia bacterium]
MQNRQQHQAQVEAFLQQSFGIREWTFTLPPGSGNETYFAHTPEHSYFIKVGGYPDRALALAEVGITPPVLASGNLPDGATIMVQPFIEGRNPQPSDYQNHLEQIAGMVRTMHHDPQVKKTLPFPTSDLHIDGALRALTYAEQQWSIYKTQMTAETDFLDKSLVDLLSQVDQLTGAGLVASHGDFCNANMLITPQGKLYIIDLELMSLDDPALDLGAVLWWYYPPEMRRRFIEAAGYEDTPELRHRMQVRTALQCLCAALPRPTGFDTLDPTSYSERLADFRAVFEGKENPQGY